MIGMNGLSGWTVLARVYISNISTGGQEQTIFAVSNTTESRNSVLRFGGGDARFSVYTWDGSNRHAIPATNMAVGWHDAAMVIDHDANEQMVYQDGEVATAPIANVASRNYEDAAIGYLTSFERNNWGQIQALKAGGEIQFVRIVGRALSAYEIGQYFDGVSVFDDSQLLHDWTLSTISGGSLVDAVTETASTVPAGVTPYTPAEVRQAIPDLKPARYYPLTDSAGQGFLEASPRGLHAKAYGGLAPDAAGPAFDGVDDYVDMLDGFEKLSGGYTAYIEAKFDRASTSIQERLFELSNSGYNDLAMIARENATQLDATDWHSGGATNWTIGGDISDQQWHKILSVKKADGTRELYIDDSTTPVAASGNPGAMPPDIIRTDCFLGRGDAGQYLQGGIKHFGFWERPLIPDEIAAVFAGNALDGKIDPDEQSVTLLIRGNGDLKDETGSSQPALEGGAFLSAVEKRFGSGSIGFDGDFASVAFPQSPMPLANSGVAWTIEGWIFISGANTLARGHTLWGQCNNSSNGENMVRLHTDGLLVYDRRSTLGGTAISEVEDVGDDPTGKWVHIAHCFDGSEHRIYYHGAKFIQVADTLGWGHGNQPFRLGQGYIPSYPQFRHALNGYLDEIRITTGVARYSADFSPQLLPFKKPELPITYGRYWRLYITDTNDPVYAGISELEFFRNGIKLDTSAATPSASSTHTSTRVGGPIDGVYEADGSAVNAWASNVDIDVAPAWWMLDFGASTGVDSIQITARPYNAQAPTDWKFQVSDDGSTWSDALDFTGDSWAADEKRFFALGEVIPPEPVVVTAAQFWRIRVLSADSGYSSIADLKMLVAGVDQIGSGTISSSDNYTTNESQDKAIDGNLTTVWTHSKNNLPAWIQYDFGAGNDVLLDEIQITYRTNVSGQGVREFEIQSSTDGSTWETMKSVTTPSWALGEMRSFPIP